jgi:hypothetical protein
VNLHRERHSAVVGSFRRMWYLIRMIHDPYPYRQQHIITPTPSSLPYNIIMCPCACMRAQAPSVMGVLIRAPKLTRKLLEPSGNAGELSGTCRTVPTGPLCSGAQA